MTENNSYTFLKNLTPTLIVAASVLIGLLGGAKIVSEGIQEANRFQFINTDDNVPMLFDSANGTVLGLTSVGWNRLPRSEDPENISGTLGWVRYLKKAERHLKAMHRYTKSGNIKDLIGNH